ncbi:MAG: FKBP-type peptidyl-prolyl cis-trans isomerase [Phycisphaerales bacterium]|nr:FKBP-type peptidyl-prolyl cis-trans isomerase [Phycisphaerales bacterium]
MTTRSFTKSAALFTSFMLVVGMVGCKDSKPKVDPEGPQNPESSNQEVDSAKATPEAGTTTTTLELTAATPDFDAAVLPGITARTWTNTPGGSWYATVMPGQGNEMVDETNSTVTVSMSMWTEDGTPVLLTEEAQGDMVLPMGEDMFAGWNETIRGMRVGETRKIAVPWNQSLGEDGHGLVWCEDGSENQQMLVGDIRLIAIDEVTEAPNMPLASAGS